MRCPANLCASRPLSKTNRFTQAFGGNCKAFSYRGITISLATKEFPKACSTPRAKAIRLPHQDNCSFGL